MKIYLISNHYHFLTRGRWARGGFLVFIITHSQQNKAVFYLMFCWYSWMNWTSPITSPLPIPSRTHSANLVGAKQSENTFLLKLYNRRIHFIEAKQSENTFLLKLNNQRIHFIETKLSENTFLLKLNNRRIHFIKVKQSENTFHRSFNNRRIHFRWALQLQNTFHRS